MSVEAQSKAYVLCVRAYRNTSALVDFFTREHGVLRAVVQGLYSQRKEKIYWQGMLRPMQELQISWKGHGDLKNLSDVNAVSHEKTKTLKGHYLYCGFYLNELLSRALQTLEPYPELYALYQESLAYLAEAQDMQWVLRQFELSLLQELGYGIDFFYDINGDDIDNLQQYYFDPEAGFAKLDQAMMQTKNDGVKGEYLIKLANNDLRDVEVKRLAKTILRRALRVHIGSKPLASRQFFSTINE